jgi:hypothetical protein
VSTKGIVCGSGGSIAQPGIHLQTAVLLNITFGLCAIILRCPSLRSTREASGCLQIEPIEDFPTGIAFTKHAQALRG